jgi:hypothetical protein
MVGGVVGLTEELGARCGKEGHRGDRLRLGVELVLQTLKTIIQAGYRTAAAKAVA